MEDKKYNIKLEIEPEKVVSDGQQNVSVRCVFTPDLSDKKPKSPKREEIPVRFKCRKLRIDEEKMATRGVATLKIEKLRRPVGRVTVTASTPYGDVHARLVVAPTPAQWARDMIGSLVIAFVVAMIIVRPFLLQTFYIPSESMKDTFLIGDRVLATMFSYRFSEPQRGDIVIFKSFDCEDKKFLWFEWNSCVNYIKRLIAVGGDTVEIRNGVTYVNDKPLNEPYLHFEDADPVKMQANYPKTKIPPGMLFFMGDNRNRSKDSRFWGDSPRERAVARAVGGICTERCCFMPRDRVVAKAWVQFWPPHRMKMVPHTRR